MLTTSAAAVPAGRRCAKAGIAARRRPSGRGGDGVRRAHNLPSSGVCRAGAPGGEDAAEDADAAEGERVRGGERSTSAAPSPPRTSRRKVFARAAQVTVLALAADKAGALSAVKPKPSQAKGPVNAPPAPGLDIATFAGGCFWCMEKPFDDLAGVVSTTSGYTGGDFRDPTYEDVCYRKTGHLEAVRVAYDPSVVSYEQLVDEFWKSIDPTDAGGQFVDRGEQYRSAIFVHSPEQRETAERTRDALQASGVLGRGKRVRTEIREASDFWPAEDYHQDYYLQPNTRYKLYRNLSGRDQYLRGVWGDKYGGHEGGADEGDGEGPLAPAAVTKAWELYLDTKQAIGSATKA